MAHTESRAWEHEVCTVVERAQQPRNLNTIATRAVRAIFTAVYSVQVNGIDQDVKLNKALWILSQRMAEMKGADSLAA